MGDKLAMLSNIAGSHRLQWLFLKVLASDIMFASLDIRGFEFFVIQNVR